MTAGDGKAFNAISPACARDQFLRSSQKSRNCHWSSDPTTITMTFFRSGYPVEYVPIIAGRREGKSHIRPLQDGVRFFWLFLKSGRSVFAIEVVLIFMMGLMSE